MAKATKTAAKVQQERIAIVANGPYGLWYGRVVATDEEIRAAGQQVRVFACRSVRQWYGRYGGLTSLAAYGPCGPRAQESRIGAPRPCSRG